MASVTWGPRSSRLSRNKRDSFWLRPPVLANEDPVRVRAFDQVPATRSWLDKKQGVPLTVANFRESAQATFALPDVPPKAIALDIVLELAIGPARAVALRLQQLFTVYANDVLMPQRYARREVIVTVKPNDGVEMHDLAPPKELVGLHPLLTVTAAGIELDVEFLDITELWWQLRAGRSDAATMAPGDWYVHPALGGQPERLRVLAATTPGDGPMIWMAWPSEAALVAAPKIQPLIFLIASAWLNVGMGFAHKLTAEGVASAAMSGRPLFAAGRFLLSSVPTAGLDALRKATPAIPEFQIWRIATDVLKATVPDMPGMAPGQLWPAVLCDPAKPERGVLPINDRKGHRLAGHEADADASEKPLLLLYPIGANAKTAYASIGQEGLASRMDSLLNMLFSVNAVALAATTPPQRDDLIVASHSNGAMSLWAALGANGVDIAKCVTFDAAEAAVPESHTAEIAEGMLGRGQRPFTLVLVTSPNSYTSASGLSERVKKVATSLSRNKNARLVMLPAEKDQAAFWDPSRIRPNNASPTNPRLRSMLSAWSDSEVAAAVGRNVWGFLFFHEFAAYGGQSLSTSFFREALDA